MLSTYVYKSTFVSSPLTLRFQDEIGLTYDELSVLGRLRRPGCHGPYGMFLAVLPVWSEKYTVEQVLLVNSQGGPSEVRVPSSPPPSRSEEAELKWPLSRGFPPRPKPNWDIYRPD